MKEREVYTQTSLELHLFFLRIMKEHAIFLTAGFTPANAAFSREANQFKTQFENLLFRAVRLGDGVIRPEILDSHELVTDCTFTAEQQTENLTGIQINKKITRMEENLSSDCSPEISVERSHNVKHLNQQVMMVLDKFIRFKENILRHVNSCEMFTVNYPTLIEHILHEACYYRDKLMALENENSCDCTSEKADEAFWNHIMMEHALFIRGLLDPAENKLIVSSNSFAVDYAELLDSACETGCCQNKNNMERLSSLSETKKFRDFKQTATVGIIECKIKSIILPLLADHVLREANHYLRLLH